MSMIFTPDEVLTKHREERSSLFALRCGKIHILDRLSITALYSAKCGA